MVDIAQQHGKNSNSESAWKKDKVEHHGKGSHSATAWKK